MRRSGPALAGVLVPCTLAQLAGGLLAVAGAAGAVAVGVAAVSLALAVRVSTRWRTVAVATAFGLALGAAAAGRRAMPLAPDHIGRHVGRAVSALEGTVVGSERAAGRRIVTVAAERIRGVGGTALVRGLVAVTIAHPRGDWPVGARVRVVARLRHPRNFGNPGGYDYVGALARRGVRVTCFLWDERGLTLLAEAPTGPAAILRRLRASASRRITGVASGPVAGYLGAVVLGERGDLGEDTRRVLARTGLAHVASVSGFHVAVVAGAAVVGVRATLGRLAWLALSCEVRKVAALVAAGPVLLYAGIAGGHVPASRAVLMFGVLLGAMLLDRPPDGLRALALAASLLALATPDIAADVSFELSFVSVAAIVLVAGRRRRQPPAVRGRGRALLSQLVLEPTRVTLAASLATAPLSAWHFQQVSLIAPVANVLALPLLGPLTLLPALAAVPFVEAAPALADALLGLAARAADLGLRLAGQLARVPGAAVTTPMPSLVELAIAYAALVWGLGGRRTPADAGGPSAERVGRPRGWPHGRALAAAVLVTAMLADGAYWTWERWRSSVLRVTFLSVGQGDAAVVELPRGRVMVVDGGGLPGAFDPGERIVAPFLRSRKIGRIDVLALSHPQLDHYEGLAYLAEHFNPREFWSTGARSASAGFARLEAALARAGARRVTLRAGTTIDLGDARIDVVHPGDPAGLGLNDASLVLRLAHGRASFLFSGDVERAAEVRLAARAASIASTVLKVPHHGSATSSSSALLRAVGARVAIVSVGWNNRFGFPARDVLTRLEGAGAVVCRTDRDGAVRVEARDGRLRVRSWGGRCAANLDLNSQDRFGSSARFRKPLHEATEWREGIP